MHSDPTHLPIPCIQCLLLQLPQKTLKKNPNQLNQTKHKKTNINKSEQQQKQEKGALPGAPLLCPVAVLWGTGLAHLHHCQQGQL